jgi:Cys-rich protein (TIGR01571 family)
MLYPLPLPSFRNPIFLLLFPCVLVGGIYRDKLRKKYASDVCAFGSLINVVSAANDFDSRIFSCLVGHKSAKKAVFNCICCPVRMAANQSASACQDYWSGLIMMVILFPLIPIFGYIHRLHLRDLYSLEPHPVADFFAWVCCYCCALTQESKFIDHGFNLIRVGSVADALT